MLKKNIGRNKWKINYKSVFCQLERLSILLAILGLTAVQIISLIWSEIPLVKICKEEKKIEQIKITQNYEYVEQILGRPSVKKDFSFPMIEGEEAIIGSKAIFCSELYTIISYFNNDGTLQGYFLISHKNSFSPNMFRKKDLIGKKLSCYDDELFGGALIAISSSYITRRDGSSHFMKYYYHHLGTNGCLIGIGVSSLGFVDDYKKFTSLAGEEDNFVFNIPIDYNEYKNRFAQVNHYNINAFAMFIYQDSPIDVKELIREETTFKLGMSEIEHAMLYE